MKQQSFTDLEYANRKRTTKREAFLKAMDEMIPWSYWVGVIRPYYPTGKRGIRAGIQRCIRQKRGISGTLE